MGKTKMYADTEGNSKQQGGRATPVKQTKRSRMPGTFVFEQREIPTLNVLFRQIVWRLRRNWIAFRFQANRYTLGLFRERTVLKLSTLGLLSYIVLFTEVGTNLLNEPSYTEYEPFHPVETSLEVTEKPKGKSLVSKSKSVSPVTYSTDFKPVNKPKNDAAPLSVKQMDQTRADLYVARYSTIAVKEMHRYGIPASISLAQGLVESRFGTSKLAVRNNNHFGMKCFSKNCPRGHCSNHLDDHHKDFFRKYQTPWESWRAHSQMLANGRYAKLKKYGRHYRDWAKGLERLGYATDPSYSEKLIGVIERYNLDRFDR
ncbi:MAG: glucosaminidase domain-containing protein [Saprospiraceae bacterium]